MRVASLGSGRRERVLRGTVGELGSGEGGASGTTNRPPHCGQDIGVPAKLRLTRRSTPQAVHATITCGQGDGA